MWCRGVNKLHSTRIILERPGKWCVATVWIRRRRRDGGKGFGELFFEGFCFGVERGAGLCIAYSLVSVFDLS